MFDEDGESPEQPDLEVPEEVEGQEEEIEPAEAIFADGKGYVGADDADRISQQGFYGTRTDDGRLELEPVEILHLIERKRLIVRLQSGEPCSASTIVSKLLREQPDLWTRYLVFRDLRSRGYAVRQGFGGGIGFRVYARGEKPGSASANQLVYVLKEGDVVSLQELATITETASAARKKLVFALVDQNGEVNFYRVAQVVLHNRQGDTV
ncbi:MAG: tRNA-intron lyase [Candidatus Thorarchaeota archaeon]|nr:tRNA-intron lyase [Candidatus Thorarchaeota archaeon]